MLTDIVDVTTSDGITLGGAYFAPTDGTAAQDSMAVLFFHGDGGHFYRRLYMELGEHLAAQGFGALMANRRGHDLVSSGAPGSLAGYAFETVAESSLDVAAWLGHLRDRGHRRMVVGGHSGGAVRAVYAQSSESFADVVGVLPVSPGEYNHQTVIGEHGDEFIAHFEECEENLAQGRPDTFLRPGIPFGVMWTARTFVDCFHRDNRYSVVARGGQTGCPTMFIFGSEECAGPQVLPICGAARRGLEAAGHPNVVVNVIDGANHGYQGRESQLFETISSWLRTL